MIPGLSRAHDGVRIGHLSDLHVGTVTPDARIRRALELVESQAPDLVALTGDFAARTSRPLARLGGLLRGLERPTAFVLGNHDHFVDPVRVARTLEGLGYLHLDNRHHTLTVRGEPLHLIGLDDPVTGHHDPARAVADLPRGGTRILLSHLAEALRAFTALGETIHLGLSGHTHGGQIYVPRLTPRVLRRKGLVHLRGLQRLDGAGPWVHVSVGVGSSIVPHRLASPPEATVLTLRAAASSSARR